jgi:UDP:flavonoid glycosyltransferase YjiC (YdhE family)
MNILLATFGTAGDVHPFIGLGSALRRRGHRITLMVSAFFERLARENDFDFVPLGTAEAFRRTLEHPHLWKSINGGRILARAMADAIPLQYEAILERHVPGETMVIAVGACFGARMAHEKFGVPLVSVVLQPMAIRTTHQMPIVAPLPRVPNWMPRLAKRVVSRGLLEIVDQMLYVGEFNAFRSSVGLKPVKRLLDNWWLSPQLVLAMFPDWFGPRQPDWPLSLRHTGFPMYDGQLGVNALPDDVAAFLREGEPPIVFTPGSGNMHARAFFESASEACVTLRRRGMLLSQFADQVPSRLPAGVRHFSFVPFADLLPRAAALVHHGGIGTMAQAMAAGIPQLIMPMAFDQPDNADRVKRLGVGDWLKPRSFRPRKVAGKLQQLLESPDVKEACRVLAERLRSGDAIELSCDLIEELMERANESPKREAVAISADRT